MQRSVNLTSTIAVDNYLPRCDLDLEGHATQGQTILASTPGALRTNEAVAVAVARGRSERDRQDALIESLQTAMEGRGRAVIQLDEAGRIVHVAPLAWELLAAYCGELPVGSGLPLPVDGWRRTQAETLTIEGGRGQLCLRRIPGRWPAILLEERRPQAIELEAVDQLGLTRRQAQILRLLTLGKRTDQIAGELLISISTVRKHLEHIYAQLGVRTRAQAVALVRWHF